MIAIARRSSYGVRQFHTWLWCCSFLAIFPNVYPTCRLDRVTNIPCQYERMARATSTSYCNFFDVHFHSIEAKIVTVIIKIINGERRSISPAERGKVR